MPAASAAVWAKRSPISSSRPRKHRSRPSDDAHRHFARPTRRHQFVAVMSVRNEVCQTTTGALTYEQELHNSPAGNVATLSSSRVAQSFSSGSVRPCYTKAGKRAAYDEPARRHQVRNSRREAMAVPPTARVTRTERRTLSNQREPPTCRRRSSELPRAASHTSSRRRGRSHRNFSHRPDNCSRLSSYRPSFAMH